jgi:NitT/TauT family transport system substrate-binding protein
MPDVLKGGSVDLVATAEPFVGRIVQGQIGTAVTAFSNDLASGFSSVLYVSTRQWAVANPQAVKAFREALQEAIAFGNANKDKGYEDIGKYFKVPPPVLRATPWPNWVATLKDDHLRFWVDTMRSQEMLKKQPMLGSAILP